jgi:serine/threonine protein kinase HipA of HipAB toxin-antitoxin module
MNDLANARLPDYLRRELGRGQAAADVPRLVAQLELFGLEVVVVVRLQLGDMRAERFGEWREVYRTKKEEKS